MIGNSKALVTARVVATSLVIYTGANLLSAIKFAARSSQWPTGWSDLSSALPARSLGDLVPILLWLVAYAVVFSVWRNVCLGSSDDRTRASVTATSRTRRSGTDRRG